MNPLIYSLFVSLLACSTVLVMMSHHWMLAWLGLEINTMAMIPIIAQQHHPRATEAAMKYFLTQTVAALLVLYASTINATQTGHWTLTNITTPSAQILLTLALTMKMGVAPMHAWFSEVLQGTKTSTALILATTQKLPPLTLLILNANHMPPNILLFLGALSTLWGGLAALNQTNLRKIMAFSSIAHMGWIMIALTLNTNLTTLAFLLYMTLTAPIFMTMMTTSTKTLADLATTWIVTPMLTSLLMLSLFSLGGLPPLTGFIPKMLITDALIKAQLTPLAIFLMLASLPSLFFYIRLAYLTTLTNPPGTTNSKHKWRQPPTKFNLVAPMIALATPLLPMLPLMYATP
uniref:NADH-ubiquinone oxidoreductase chain 2 n=1 Tax=Gonatodes albogularis TaxID=460622 RepID=A0A1Y1CC08_GONAL|nr:NADH dehydrogenase subunit 2 [Gonatodes albogularis]BAX77885.1 NADH dehydrogenase subunit 2 [Gonatodes albogularis]